MSRSKLQLLVRHALPMFPGFATKGRLMFMAPIDQMLCGICVEPSGFDKVQFDMVRFVMPLCVPSTFVSFSFGSHFPPLTKNTGWTMKIPNVADEVVQQIRNVALPFLTQRTTPLDFLAATQPTDNLHDIQARAYCLALVGRFGNAVTLLDRLLEQGPGEIAWEVVLFDRARDLRAMLLGDPAAAQRQLIAWEAETVEHLGLTQFRRVADPKGEGLR